MLASLIFAELHLSLSLTPCLHRSFLAELHLSLSLAPCLHRSFLAELHLSLSLSLSLSLTKIRTVNPRALKFHTKVSYDHMN